MVVEDHADSRTALTWLLTAHGHQVEAVGAASSALDALSQDDFDVLLTDILMPGLSCWDLLRTLKASNHLPPRVVTMSAMHLWEAQPLSREAGCHAHLVKPFLTEELVQALEQSCV